MSFIELIKGTRLRDEYNEYREGLTMDTLFMHFRGKTIYLKNLEDLKVGTYLGVKLDLSSAKLLVEFLNDCIASSQTRCDQCWNYSYSDSVFIRGTVSCSYCGAILQEFGDNPSDPTTGSE
jgi:hypothetical protein